MICVARRAAGISRTPDSMSVVGMVEQAPALTDLKGDPKTGEARLARLDQHSAGIAGLGQPDSVRACRPAHPGACTSDRLQSGIRRCRIWHQAKSNLALTTLGVRAWHSTQPSEPAVQEPP